MRYVFLPALLGALVITAVARAQPYDPRYYPRDQRSRLDGADRLVRYWYKSYLRRPVRSRELRNMAGLLRSDKKPAEVLAGLLASREYVKYAGGTRAGYIKQLLLDVGHHEPSPREIRHYLSRTRGQKRGEMAYSFLLRYGQNWRPGLETTPPDEFDDD